MRSGTGLTGLRLKQEIEGVVSLQLYSKNLCRSIIEYSQAMDAWVTAPVAEREPNGAVGSVAARQTRSADGFSPSNNSKVRQLFDLKMTRIITPLINRIWKVQLSGHTSTHVVRYLPGDFYLPHTDDFADRNYRYFTALCYLNDDFTGGHTSFPTLGFSIEPRAGKMIIFPSSYLHCSELVTSGEKYVIVSWVVGPAPVEWI
jgi:hypothetical protein